MSRISELKSNPENCINIVDILSLLCPEGKVKYVETLLRIVKSTSDLDEAREDCLKSLESDYSVDRNLMTEYSDIQVIHIKKFLDDVMELDDIKKFQKFCTYNERSLIEENDLSRYSKFAEVHAAVNRAELKLTEKEMESQIIRLYEDDEWLVLKPLTYEASKKYGANTKWCTTTSNDSTHFDRYGQGILIYSLNKRNSHKVAAYKDLSENELSFWDPTDIKIDSMSSGLSFDILKVIKDDMNSCKTGNTLVKKKK